MGQATASRWDKHGKDRVYVNASDGTSLGFLDLKTGHTQQVPVQRAAEFHDAISRWRQDNPAVTIPTPAPASARTPRPRRAPIKPAAPTAGDTAARATPRPAPRPRPAPTPASAPAGSSRAWVDLAANQPGQGPAQVAAAYREAHPVATRLARLFGRHTDERAWQAGADGEMETARRLRELTEPPSWQFSDVGTWHVLHGVPVGERGSDIDHVLIGVSGVFTINTKHHRDKLITTTPTAVIINKHRTRHAEIARAEADRAAQLLAAAVGGRRVPVAPVISVVGAGALVANHQPHGVTVIAVKKLVDWVLHQPAVYRPTPLRCCTTSPADQRPGSRRS